MNVTLGLMALAMGDGSNIIKGATSKARKALQEITEVDIVEIEVDNA